MSRGLHESVNPENVVRAVADAGAKFRFVLTHTPTNRTVSALVPKGQTGLFYEVTWSCLESTLDPTVRVCRLCGYAVTPSEDNAIAGMRADLVREHMRKDHGMNRDLDALRNIDCMEEV